MSAWVHTLVVVVFWMIGASPRPAGTDVSVVSALGARPPGSRSAPGVAAPLGAEARGREVLERAIAVHGGRVAWRARRDVFFSTTWTHYRGGRPSFSTRYMVKFLTRPGAGRALVEAAENGKPVLMGMSGSRSWFRVGDEAHDDPASLRANRAFVKKAYLLLSLPFLLDDPAYRVAYDGREVRGGAEMDRLLVEHGLDPSMYLLFESATGRFAGMGSVVAEYPTTTLGEAHDHEVVRGILVPRTQSFDRVDPSTGRITRSMVVSIDAVKFDNGYGEETFEPPL